MFWNSSFNARLCNINSRYRTDASPYPDNGLDDPAMPLAQIRSPCLQLARPLCIDTVLLFHHTRGRPLKLAWHDLRASLAESHLRVESRTHVHGYHRLRQPRRVCEQTTRNFSTTAQCARCAHEFVFGQLMKCALPCRSIP